MRALRSRQIGDLPEQVALIIKPITACELGAAKSQRLARYSTANLLKNQQEMVGVVGFEPTTPGSRTVIGANITLFFQRFSSRLGYKLLVLFTLNRVPKTVPTSGATKGALSTPLQSFT